MNSPSTAVCALGPLLLVLSACAVQDTGAHDSDTDAIGMVSASDSSTGTSPASASATSPGGSGGSGGSDASGPSPDPGDSSDSGPAGDGCGETCDNGVFCDGLEACVDGECVAGDPVVCDDGIGCTIDSCDPEEDACVHEADHALCGCGETCDTEEGCGNHCVVTLCTVNQPYQCGNCIDDDGDCLVDALDPDCWGPCDNNEDGFNGDVPGQQNQSTCNAMDCYFDNNSGSGNDECYWSHACDPLEPSGCTYDPAYNTPGTPNTCDELYEEQLPGCADYCGPLTPNGCDCFGCCELTLEDKSTVTVYLGTLDENDVGTCTLDVVDDPELCHPCTQVEACLNECDECELCLGQVELPEECDEQECPNDLQPCGLAGQEPCPEGQACVTGCCVPEPQ